MEPSSPKFSGKDYSVYNPSKARLGMRLWLEAYIRALPKQRTDDAEVPRADTD